jgi:hypothetical protein
MTGQESTNEILDKNKIERPRETQKDSRDKKMTNLKILSLAVIIFFVKAVFLCFSLSLNFIFVLSFICTFLSRRLV